jgi:circadian clock protein KaiC
MGLDELLRGGFTRGRVILVLGEPGSGKTILCSQFLLNGIQKYGEKGLFVSLEENREHYFDEMKQFDWDFDSLEKSGKFRFIDASLIRNVPPKMQIAGIEKEDAPGETLAELVKNHAISSGSVRIVVDPISHLIFHYSDPTERRRRTLDLVDALTKTGATCLLSSELMEIGGMERRVQLEEYLAHGVLILSTRRVADGGSKRSIQVEKMRGSEIDDTPRPYRIDSKNGIIVSPNDLVI